MSSDRELHRVTVNLTPRAWESATRAAGRCRDTQTDTINRAVQVYDFITRILAEGGELWFREDTTKNELQRLMIL